MSSPSLSNKKIFITGIGTDVGKTVVSAIVTSALQADYFKPVQSGDLSASDTMKIQNLLGADHPGIFYKECYRFSAPLSPHAAAELEGIRIDPKVLELPNTENCLVVEGAGGVYTPLTDTFFMIDLIEKFNLPCLVVSRSYLGSINHTILTIEALRARNIPIAGIIFNGQSVPSSESLIKQYASLIPTFHIPETKEISPQFISTQKRAILPWLHKL